MKTAGAEGPKPPASQQGEVRHFCPPFAPGVLRLGLPPPDIMIGLRQLFTLKKNGLLSNLDIRFSFSKSFMLSACPQPPKSLFHLEHPVPTSLTCPAQGSLLAHSIK